MGGYVEYDYDPQGNLETALQGGPGVGTVLTSMNHDLRGRKLGMVAPDHGAWSYVHNAFGELVKQTDAKQQITTAAFDRAGRLIRRDHYGAGENPASVQPLDRAEWIWMQGKVVLEDTHRRLTSSEMEPLPRLSRNFVYDLLGRVQEVHTTIQGTPYEERTTYDQYGRVFQRFDASGMDRGAEHVYNGQGYLRQVIEAQFSATTSQVHHEVLAMNARGQVTSQRKGGTTETRDYHPATGLPSQFQVSNAAQQTLDTQSFQFDALGNLEQRTQGSHSESFQYDDLNRLRQINTSGPAPNVTIHYDALGNIESKTGVGSYQYGAGSAGPHAVTSAGGVSYAYDANGNMISGNGRTISWMPFNKPAQIQQGNRSVTFEYGPMRERYQRIDSTPSGTTITRYVGSVEIITRPGGTELKRYLPGGIVVTVTGTSSERLALFHDHLGSVTLIVNDAGAVAQRLAYDAFGKRRSTIDWTTLSDSQIWGFNTLRTTRGFTFHEQLDPVGLVHMNGRVYDPHLGRFLSPDPFVQAPGDTQNLNRYSYVLNNPLSYTDPSGYFFKKIGKAIGKAVKRAVRGVLEFGAGIRFGPADWFNPYLFWASVAFHVARATQRSGGSSPPGAFGNGGNIWRGGGRTVFVPALNGGHGHGFLSAGLTGFAHSDHSRGVHAGRRHIAVESGAGTWSAIAAGKFGNGSGTRSYSETLAERERLDRDRRAARAAIDEAIRDGRLTIGTFGDAHEAARHLLGVLDAISMELNVELGAFIRTNPEGEGVRVTEIYVGNRVTVPEMNSRYVTDDVVAGVHTHPDGNPLFSDADLQWVHHVKRPLYVGAGGTIRVCEHTSARCSLKNATQLPLSRPRSGDPLP